MPRAPIGRVETAIPTRTTAATPVGIATACYGGRSGPQREEYIAGYRAGYSEGGYGNRDRDRDDRDRNGHNGNGQYGNGQYGNGQYGNGQYGNSGYLQQAYNFGFEDGQRLGSTDRATGHSYRPTHDDRWRDADRGYSGSMGDKQAYKNAFRSGYQAGYDRGYGRR